MPLHLGDDRPVGAFTIDLEDWQQSVFDHSLPVSSRFLVGTARMLKILEETKTNATWFVLGNVAIAEPALIRELHAAGHEIQTHGWAHTELHDLGPEGFRQDVLRARGTIEDIIGQPVTGYRAPRFSIDARTIWALDVLAECGFVYDASIFPLRVRSYGIRGWCAQPHLIRTQQGREISEWPVSVGRMFGKPLPIGGGGYVRLAPAWMLHRQFNLVRSEGRPIVVYCHPHEFDPHAFHTTPRRVPFRFRLHQGIGRRGFAAKMRNLLQCHKLTSIANLRKQVCEQMPSLGTASPGTGGMACPPGAGRED